MDNVRIRTISNRMIQVNRSESYPNPNRFNGWDGFLSIAGGDDAGLTTEQRLRLGMALMGDDLFRVLADVRQGIDMVATEGADLALAAAALLDASGRIAIWEQMRGEGDMG